MTASSWTLVLRRTPEDRLRGGGASSAILDGNAVYGKLLEGIEGPVELQRVFPGGGGRRKDGAVSG